MADFVPKIRTAILFLLGCSAICVPIRAQSGTSPQDPSAAPANISTPPLDAVPIERPLPNIVAMMHDVETNQRKAESIEKDYLYHSVATEQEFGSNGQIKKTTITESDHFWLNGVPVRRVVKKDGKPLTPEEIAKENDRIDKSTAKASERREKADNQGKQTDPRGNEEVTVSRLLELGAFTNPRRVLLNGREAIAVDYTGDPKAKTRNRAEDVIRDMVGTVWVDEQDHVLAKVEGHFANAFKIGGGLIVNVQKDTHFAMEQTKVNGEVWLPARVDAQGAARVLLVFNFNGKVHAVQSDYRKFRTTSTVLPAIPPENTPQPSNGAAHP